MKILFITDNFIPESNAPAARTFEHASVWVEMGYMVTIITCAPNYPSGKVFDGFSNRLYSKEMVHGIEVIRVWSFITANKGFLLRILDFLSFMISSFIAGIFINQKPTHVIGTSPQFFTLISAYLVAKLKRASFVAEIRDLWPESIKALGILQNRLIFKTLVLTEEFLYKKSDKIVVVTDSFKKDLVSRSIDPNKIIVIKNSVNSNLFKPMNKDYDLVNKLRLRKKFVVGYIGTLGESQGLEVVCQSARIFKKMNIENISIIIVGDGSDRSNLEQYIKKHRLLNIKIVPRVSRNDVARYMSLLDIAIVHLRDLPEFRKVIPSKIFELFAMGIPILYGLDGEADEIIEKAGGGVKFIQSSSNDLARKMIQLQKNIDLRTELSRKGLAASSYYSRKDCAISMINFISEKLK